MKNRAVVISAIMILLAQVADAAVSKTDSLLIELDRTVEKRQFYTAVKQKSIDSLKAIRSAVSHIEDIYKLNSEIAGKYTSLLCDSAIYYCNENIRLSGKMKNPEKLMESRLNIALLYSLSGLFLQADRIFSEFDYDCLPNNLKALYNWNKIRYYENIIAYTQNPDFIEDYRKQKAACRDSLCLILDHSSDLYLKEKAFKLQDSGDIEGALDIFRKLFAKEVPDTHGWSMMCMGLANLCQQSGAVDSARVYRIHAAISDIKLAVKDNEALTVLATELYEEGDYDRAYHYVKSALDDAKFYNSRFKNTVIARVYPIIENTYMMRLNERNKVLRTLNAVTCILLMALFIIIMYVFKQARIISRSKINLERMNDNLTVLNARLDEANMIKEKYVGYFINKTAASFNRLDEYRKTVVRKIKAGQTADICKESMISLDSDLQELYATFDTAFLKLYPDFVAELNSHLTSGHKFVFENGALNPEVRILALMRLGISDVRHIASFLHYSMQTVYNYKSKVRKMTGLSPESFDKMVENLSKVNVSHHD